MPSLSRGELNDLLAGFAVKNPKYRQSLMKDPRAVIEKQLNNALPKTMKVKVVEDTPDTIHFVLPYVPTEGAQLSESQLESVAGGFLDEYTCNFRAGQGSIGTRVEISLI